MSDEAQLEVRYVPMMELDPVYCDVIVKRWEDLTGLKAVRPSPAK